MADVELSIVMRARDVASRVIANVGEASQRAGNLAQRSFSTIQRAQGSAASAIRRGLVVSFQAIPRAAARASRQTLRAVRGLASGVRRAVLGIPGILAAVFTGGGALIAQRLIQAASDAEETRSKFEVVFRGLVDESNSAAVAIADGFGRSQTEVEGFLATLQDTFVPLGFARDQGLLLSDALTRLSIDLGSFNNQADGEVLAALQSALVGNTETVRRFGVIITEATTKDTAYRLGIAETGAELTEQQKVLSRYAQIVEQTGDAQGDAIRTADSYANSVKALRADVADLSVEFGQRLIQQLQESSAELGGAERISNLLVLGFEALTQAGQGVIRFGARLVGTALNIVDSLGGVEQARELVSRGMGVLGDVFGSLGALARIVFTGLVSGFDTIVTSSQASRTALRLVAQFLAAGFASAAAIGADGLAVILEGAENLANFLLDGLVVGLDAVLERLQGFLQTAASVADAVGFDGTAESARNAAAEIEGVRAGLAGVAAAGVGTDLDDRLEGFASKARLIQRQLAADSEETFQQLSADVGAYLDRLNERQPGLLEALDDLRERSASAFGDGREVFAELKAALVDALEEGAAEGGAVAGGRTAEEIAAQLLANRGALEDALRVAMEGAGDAAGAAAGQRAAEAAEGAAQGSGEGPAQGDRGGFIEGLSEGVREYGEELDDAAARAAQFEAGQEGIQNVLDETGGAFSGIARAAVDGGDAFANAWESAGKRVVGAIVEMLAQFALLKLAQGIGSLFGFGGGGGGAAVGGGGGGGGGGLLGSLFAQGGTSAGVVQGTAPAAAFAQGGTAPGTVLATTAAGSGPPEQPSLAFAQGGVAAGAVSSVVPAAARSAAPNSLPRPRAPFSAGSPRLDGPSRRFAQGGVEPGQVVQLVEPAQRFARGGRTEPVRAPQRIRSVQAMLQRERVPAFAQGGSSEQAVAAPGGSRFAGVRRAAAAAVLLSAPMAAFAQGGTSGPGAAPRAPVVQAVAPVARVAQVIDRVDHSSAEVPAFALGGSTAGGERRAALSDVLEHRPATVPAFAQGGGTGQTVQRTLALEDVVAHRQKTTGARALAFAQGGRSTAQHQHTVEVAQTLAAGGAPTLPAFAQGGTSSTSHRHVLEASQVVRQAAPRALAFAQGGTSSSAHRHTVDVQTAARGGSEARLPAFAGGGTSSATATRTVQLRDVIAQGAGSLGIPGDRLPAFAQGGSTASAPAASPSARAMAGAKSEAPPVRVAVPAFAQGGSSAAPLRTAPAPVSPVRDRAVTASAAARRQLRNTSGTVQAFAQGGVAQRAPVVLATAPVAAVSRELENRSAAFAQGGRTSAEQFHVEPSGRSTPAGAVARAAQAFAQGGLSEAASSRARVHAGTAPAQAQAFAQGGVAGPAARTVQVSVPTSAAPRAQSLMQQADRLPFVAMAEGGVVNGPTLALLGENPSFGAEAFVPLPDGQTIPVTISGIPDLGGLTASQGDVAQQLRRAADALQARSSSTAAGPGVPASDGGGLALAPSGGGGGGGGEPTFVLQVNFGGGATPDKFREQLVAEAETLFALFRDGLRRERGLRTDVRDA